MSHLPMIKTTDLKKLITNDGEIKIKYLKGYPRPYRFNASSGILNLNGQTPVTKAGKTFTMIPIAYRLFKDRLFEYSKREWLELFFIDENGAIALVMFHGYSVEEFLQMTQELFYEDLSITEIEITVTPEQKESKSAKGSKYYIASFEYKKADSQYLNTVKTITEGLEIFREDTIKATNEMIVWDNYPVHLVEREQEAKK